MKIVIRAGEILAIAETLTKNPVFLGSLIWKG
jgi:hypothetical protein